MLLLINIIPGTSRTLPTVKYFPQQTCLPGQAASLPLLSRLVLGCPSPPAAFASPPAKEHTEGCVFNGRMMLQASAEDAVPCSPTIHFPKTCRTMSDFPKSHGPGFSKQSITWKVSLSSTTGRTATLGKQALLNLFNHQAHNRKYANVKRDLIVQKFLSEPPRPQTQKQQMPKKPS